MFEDDLDRPPVPFGQKRFHRVAPAVHGKPVGDEAADGKTLFGDQLRGDVEGGGAGPFLKNVAVDARDVQFLVPHRRIIDFPGFEVDAHHHDRAPAFRPPERVVQASVIADGIVDHVIPAQEDLVAEIPLEIFRAGLLCDAPVRILPSRDNLVRAQRAGHFGLEGIPRQDGHLGVFDHGFCRRDD